MRLLARITRMLLLTTMKLQMMTMACAVAKESFTHCGPHTQSLGPENRSIVDNYNPEAHAKSFSKS